MSDSEPPRSLPSLNSKATDQRSRDLTFTVRATSCCSWRRRCTVYVSGRDIHHYTAHLAARHNPIFFKISRNTSTQHITPPLCICASSSVIGRGLCRNSRRWYRATRIAWSRSYGSSVSCSRGLNISPCSFFTSAANTWAAGAVESMQFALIEITACPPFFRNWCALSATIRAWSGCATSAKMTSTIGRSTR